LITSLDKIDSKESGPGSDHLMYSGGARRSLWVRVVASSRSPILIHYNHIIAWLIVNVN